MRRRARTARVAANGHCSAGAGGARGYWHGHFYTVMSQIAADELGIPVERIRCTSSSSATVRFRIALGVRRLDDGGKRRAGGEGCVCEAVRAKLQGDAGVPVPELLVRGNTPFVEATSEVRAKPGEEVCATRCMLSVRSLPKFGSMPIWEKSASAASSAHSMPAG